MQLGIRLGYHQSLAARHWGEGDSGIFIFDKMHY